MTHSVPNVANARETAAIDSAWGFVMFSGIPFANKLPRFPSGRKIRPDASDSDPSPELHQSVQFAESLSYGRVAALLEFQLRQVLPTLLPLAQYVFVVRLVHTHIVP